MSDLRQLKVTFDSFDDLVESIGPGLSRTHLFISLAALRADARTDEVIADGTRVRLEIGTVRKGALIRGVAKVAEPAGEMPRLSPSGTVSRLSPSGLHLHLIHLDPSSTRLVDSIVRGEIDVAGAQEAGGPSPFDISPGSKVAGALSDAAEIPTPTSEPLAEPPETDAEPPEADAEPPETDAEPLETDAEPPETAVETAAAEAPAVESHLPEERPFRPMPRLAWPLALVALGAFLLVFKLSSRDDDQLLTGRDRQTEIAESTHSSVAVPANAEKMAAEPPTSDQRSAAHHPPGSGLAAKPEAANLVRRPAEAAAEQAEGVVRAWADAWSRQDPDAFLELYADNYSPPELTRGAWERQRQARIAAPGRLEVRLNELEVELVGPDRAIVRFQQLYTTEDRALAARKVLELERLKEDWRIVAERVEG